MNSFIESLIYYSVRAFGFFIRLLPVSVALWIGRGIGTVGYYYDVRHRSMAYANLKIAFARTKSPQEIKEITKSLFKNYGQNLIELLRLPLLTRENYSDFIHLEGKEHVDEAIKLGKGVLFVAMHFGSWELSSLSCSMLGKYKLVAKPQTKFSRLDDFLNSYRACSGTMTVAKGSGTREILRSLRSNELVGIVVDQGGKDGALVPFFGRQASMAVGAVRIGLKTGVPLCPCVIIRQGGHRHRMIIHEPLKLIDTGHIEKDVMANLENIVRWMEGYIEKYPAEYMWFYKIWKYSKESTTLILSDGKMGHARQSQAVARTLTEALEERGIASEAKITEVKFKSPLRARLISVLGLLANRFCFQGRLNFLQWFLTEESYRDVMNFKADFIISCGSSLASLNFLLTMDHKAKNIAILKPGLLNFKKFDLIILPRHDRPRGEPYPGRVVYTRIAPNLVDENYLSQQSELFLKRYSHLRSRDKMRIGVLLGGDAKQLTFREPLMKMMISQIKQAAEELNADILFTTSRRTSARVENLVVRELKKFYRCQVFIMANHSNIPEAVGGILGLSDIVVVSTDSISMISEAVSAKKATIVFGLKNSAAGILSPRNKYELFVGTLNDEGYVISAGAKNIGRLILDVARCKIQTKIIHDEGVILSGVRQIL